MDSVSWMEWVALLLSAFALAVSIHATRETTAFRRLESNRVDKLTEFVISLATARNSPPAGRT